MSGELLKCLTQRGRHGRPRQPEADFFGTTPPRVIFTRIWKPPEMSHGRQSAQSWLKILLLFEVWNQEKAALKAAFYSYMHS